MLILRLFLFFGLVLHKVVWEVLKARNRDIKTRQRTKKKPIVLILKSVKALILAFILIQTLFLDILAISNQATLIRIIGVILFSLGLATAITARLNLGKNWVDLEEYDVLPDQSLTTQGVYRYIRHPIYIGDIFLLLGLELALNSWLVLAVPFIFLFVVKQALAEEALLSKTLPGYKEYCAQTKRFIPFIV